MLPGPFDDQVGFGSMIVSARGGGPRVLDAPFYVSQLVTMTAGVSLMLWTLWTLWLLFG